MLNLFDLKYKFIGTSKTRDFVNSLKDIMMLREENEEANNFIVLKSGLEEFLFHYPVNNMKWKIYDNNNVKCAFHPVLKDIVCEINGNLDYFKAKIMFFPIWYQIIEKGGLIAHSALLSKDEKGILLCGPNGAGKSTAYKRFPEEFNKISDDWNVVFPGEREYLVSPWPTWSHFTHKQNEKQRKWDVNYRVPLNAVFFIEKSKIASLEQVKQGDFVMKFLEMHKELLYCDIKNLNVSDKRTLFSNIFENSWKLNRKISYYLLKISPDEDFVGLIKEVI